VSLFLLNGRSRIEPREVTFRPSDICSSLRRIIGLFLSGPGPTSRSQASQIAERLLLSHPVSPGCQKSLISPPPYGPELAVLRVPFEGQPSEPPCRDRYLPFIRAPSFKSPPHSGRSTLDRVFPWMSSTVSNLSPSINIRASVPLWSVPRFTVKRLLPRHY